MTWPFENDTSAITKKLAKRSRKADKRSKAFLLLTIALSVCMIFSIILISAGEQEEFKNTQRTKAQIAILGITDDQLSSLRQSKDVQWIASMLQSDYPIQAIRQLRSLMGAKIILRIRRKCLYKAASHKRQMKSCSRKSILTFWENHIVPATPLLLM